MGADQPRSANPGVSNLKDGLKPTNINLSQKNNDANAGRESRGERRGGKEKEGKEEETKEARGERRTGGRAVLVDVDRDVVGRKVIIHLITGQAIVAKVTILGTYWVIAETNGGRRLVINKAAIAYYEVTEQ